MNKKKIYNSNPFTLMLLIAIALSSFLFSCEEDETAGPITIDKVYLQDVIKANPEKQVSFVRLGQLIRIDGSGFTGLKRIYVNGYKSYFNPVYVTDNHVFFSVSEDTPIVDANSDERNTIRFENDSYKTVHSFDVRAAAPSITNISHTLPQVGEMITVYGTGLLEVNKVVFPGNVEITEGITSDNDGEFFTVAMPAGVSENGGSLFIECANGGAYSPASFNFTKGIILNFDGMGAQGAWGSSEGMIQSDDLISTPTGVDCASQGTYVPHRPDRIASIAAVSNRASEVWTAGNDVDDWRGQLTPFYAASTPLDSLAFQFDIFVPEEWSESGFLKICLTNGFNGGEWAGYCYNYVPWIVDGEVVPFVTEGWTTVTIPFRKFYAFSDDASIFTFEDVLMHRESASWKNFGFFFENSDFTLDKVTGNSADAETEFISQSTSVSVFTDNWRIVSIEQAVYSDFPDEE